MTEVYELEDGRVGVVVLEWERHDYTARVLRTDGGPPDEVAGDWVLTWSDGINRWIDPPYEFPWQAIARLAALVAAVEQSVFLVHLGSGRDHTTFVEEAERFVARTVHASSCPPGCDGTDTMNHGGY